ncbi:MAG: hemerythrin domain-containing protein [Candidatus Omnitrophota bacterium]|jgi:hypothetical protein
MSDYIKTWHKEHGQILELLLQVLQLDIFSRAGQMKLQELKRTLEAHLESEDRHFYPILKKAAETDTDLRRKLFLFATDMGKITAEVLAFFRKEENDPMGKDIPAEFRRISDMIKSRVSREESILMKEFEKLTSR